MKILKRLLQQGNNHPANFRPDIPTWDYDFYEYLSVLDRFQILNRIKPVLVHYLIFVAIIQWILAIPHELDIWMLPNIFYQLQ